MAQEGEDPLIADLQEQLSDARQERDIAERKLRDALAIPRSSPWRPIAEAKKDGSIIWAILRDDIYPTILPRRDDLQRWNGVQVPLRHNGLAEDGFDIGWNVAAPVGSGGFPDEWIAGWRMLPSPPPSTKGAVE
jgi:hypothetical protein